MTSTKTSILILVLALILSSCQKVIEFSGSITDPIMVVNSLVTPDSVVSVQVSKSRFFLNNSSTFESIDNANVLLYVNGLLKENLLRRVNGVYVGAYKPTFGDSIGFKIKIPEKNEIICGTTVPQLTGILSVYSMTQPTDINTPIVTVTTPKTGGAPVTDTIGTNIGRRMFLTLNFKDNPDIKNYYRLVVYTRSYSGTKYTTDYAFYFDDIVSGNSTGDEVGPPTSLSSNKFNVFSDELFNGKQYSLKFSVDNNFYYYFPGHTKPQPIKILFITLQSISKNYYLYLQTRSNIKTNSFFAEPVQVYSNIDGGVGIIGGYTSSNARINM
jgi:hypothetical protein